MILSIAEKKMTNDSIRASTIIMGMNIIFMLMDYLQSFSLLVVPTCSYPADLLNVATVITTAQAIAL